MVALLEALDFIAPHYRAEVMWRTATSKDAMTPESKSFNMPQFSFTSVSFTLPHIFFLTSCLEEVSLD